MVILPLSPAELIYLASFFRVIKYQTLVAESSHLKTSENKVLIDIDFGMLLGIGARSFASDVGLGSGINIFDPLNTRVIPKLPFLWGKF